ncbi:MAG: flagellar FlbD family protein [Bacillota bacterium]|jgi:flagellar protein FlbD|uniref:Flagellar protein FlbD n=1 Tax=[Clostridium] aminophilum TaxID=1526 RepID=A0A1I0BSS9_9FIRM|nr:flagellar FlbD family protein [[Clostridium] aminophilum]MCR4629030.1 flagellar FlbD family protein [Clostridium sp.]MDT3844630.1 flagellar FlbD family protein [Bacillota bacterium]MDD6196239.1 flagellar FlbD family protein [[Clostridium] aminophilum]SET09813.1 flagellar protein FlbD [[Clostridium] aminophilum]SFR70436.1 flagellar protein FlbD [[Clostridium] aminophilum]
MIRLTRLNGEPIILNYLQILYFEEIPETKVKLANGDYYLVKDSVESIKQQVLAFLHDVISFDSKEKVTL